MKVAKGGFDLFKYWYDLYQSASGDVLPEYDTFSSQSKVQFNVAVKIFKDREFTEVTNTCYGVPFDREYIKALLAYALYHNPYKREISYYAKIQLALSTNKMFMRWVNSHKKEILSEGILRTVLAYVPSNNIKFEFENDEDLTVEDFLEAFNYVE